MDDLRFSPLPAVLLASTLTISAYAEPVHVTVGNNSEEELKFIVEVNQYKPTVICERTLGALSTTGEQPCDIDLKKHSSEDNELYFRTKFEIKENDVVLHCETSWKRINPAYSEVATSITHFNGDYLPDNAVQIGNFYCQHDE